MYRTAEKKKHLLYFSHLESILQEGDIGKTHLLLEKTHVMNSDWGVFNWL